MSLEHTRPAAARLAPRLLVALGLWTVALAVSSTQPAAAVGPSAGPGLLPYAVATLGVMVAIGAAFAVLALLSRSTIDDPCAAAPLRVRPAAPWQPGDDGNEGRPSAPRRG